MSQTRPTRNSGIMPQESDQTDQDQQQFMPPNRRRRNPSQTQGGQQVNAQQPNVGAGQPAAQPQATPPVQPAVVVNNVAPAAQPVQPAAAVQPQAAPAAVNAAPQPQAQPQGQPQVVVNAAPAAPVQPTPPQAAPAQPAAQNRGGGCLKIAAWAVAILAAFFVGAFLLGLVLKTGVAFAESAGWIEFPGFTQSVAPAAEGTTPSSLLRSNGFEAEASALENSALLTDEQAAAAAMVADGTQAQAGSNVVTAADGTTINYTLPSDVMYQLSLLGYKDFQSFVNEWGLKVGFNLFAGEVDPRELTVCPGELQGCVRIIREKNADKYIIPYTFSFSTTGKFACWHDGFRTIPGIERPGGYQDFPRQIGVNVGYVGPVEGFVLRKCNPATGTSGTLPNASGTQPTSYVQPAANATPVPVVPTGSVTVQVPTLYMRSGAGTGFPVVGQLSLGQVVPEISRTGNWIYVQAPNGAMGYVAGWLTDAKDVVSEDDSTNEPVLPTVTPVPGQGGQGNGAFAATVVDGSTVNWETCEGGQSRCWNAYKNGNGTAVRMNLACSQDGARLVNGKEEIGLPAGENVVLGITDRGCN